MVDAADLKSVAFPGVRVRVPLSAPFIVIYLLNFLFIIGNCKILISICFTEIEDKKYTRFGTFIYRLIYKFIILK